MRVRDKTKKKIASSMVELVEKKPIDKITITDITVNCDMTRQVFYRYFVDKYDLINWMYEEDCGSIIYTGEENFSLKSWIEYIIDILEDKKSFYVHAIQDDSSKTFENLILDKTRFYLKKIIEYKTATELTKQLEFLIEMTARGLVEMIIFEIEKEMPVKKEILVDWLMNGISKEISDLVEEIQDIIESELVKANKYALSKAYILYRYKRAMVRKSNTTDDTILSIIRNDNKELKEENSNKNTFLASAM